MFNPPVMDTWNRETESGQGTGDVTWRQRISPLSKAPQQPGIALLGVCCDEGVKRSGGRTGAAEGPDNLRPALARLAYHLDRPLYDAGNVICEEDKLDLLTLEQSNMIFKLLNKGHFPLVLGGGQEIAYGSYWGLYLHLTPFGGNADIGIINIDAHFDLSQADEPGSDTPFLQIAKSCRNSGSSFHYFCLGINENSNTRALFERADDLGVEYLLDEELAGWELQKAEDRLWPFIRKNGSIYLSIHLDALPASVAPGVSSPAGRGLPLEVVEYLVKVIKSMSEEKLKIADITEFNPRYDIDGRTALTAARLCHLLSR